MKERLKCQIWAWTKEKEKSGKPLLLNMEIEPNCDVEEADEGATQHSLDDITF